MLDKLNSYDLSRDWFDFAFENPSKITPSHGILYFFIVEHCNRLGWKKEFGLPTTMAKDAIGIRSYNSYIKCLNDLIDWGFIIMVEKSKNQYSSNIIALSKFDKALDKALDKAFIKHCTKQHESTVQSIDSINKQINNKQETIYTEKQILDFEKFELWILENCPNVSKMKQKFTIDQFVNLSDIIIEYGRDTVRKVLINMGNWTKLKSNVSANLTLRNWITKETKKEQRKQLPTSNIDFPR